MTHIYDGAAARRLVRTIPESYIPAFLHMQEGILQYYKQEKIEQI